MRLGSISCVCWLGIAYRNLLRNYLLSSNVLNKLQAMEELWSNGKIEIEGNLNLARDINAAMYNILCSLPVKKDPLIPFYGLSPGMHN